MAEHDNLDVVVVGGGIGGVTAAAFAARAGASVLLLEGAPELGGRARTRAQKGFLFNHGPHALYLKCAGKRALDALGIDPPGKRPGLGHAYLMRDGELHVAPAGLGDLAKTSAFSAADKIAFALAFTQVSAGFKGRPGETLAAALNRLTPSLPAQAGIKAFVRVSSYSNAPDIGAADALFDQVRAANAGVRYLDGGWSTLVAAIADKARSDGAKMETGARIASVEQIGGGWRVTRADGASVEARAVILAISPEEAAALTGHQTLKEAAANAVPVRAASLDVALSRLPRASHVFALGLDEPTYFSVHSASAKLAPEGGALIHVSRYLAPEEIPSRDTKAHLEHLLDLMQPGWRDVLVAEQWLPMATVSHDMPQAARGGLSGRCPVNIAPGLYVAGDWAGAEALISDAAFASGRLAGEGAAALSARKAA